MLGMANTASISNAADPQYRRTNWGFFLQDTWKVTRKLTFDYGIRYDLQPAADELHYRTSMFAPTLNNPNAGNLPGATIYAGYNDPKRCNCIFTSTYPYAFAPRLGLAYQLTPKTVLRAGWGLSYGQLTGFNYIGGGNSQGMGFNTIPFDNPAFGEAAVLLRQGLVYNPNDLTAASYDPSLRVVAGQLNTGLQHIDRNGGRPPRINQWNISLQRELTKDLVLEGAYVGNRGAWFRADGLVNYNAVTPAMLAAVGLNINNAADRTLLTSRIDSPQVRARGFVPPYAGFPGSATLAQSLRPFPQFTTINSLWAPLGNNWYDSLQIKATKRYSYGLDFSVAYTWSKTLTTVEDQNGETVPTNDVFNRRNQKALSRTDQPHVFVVGFNYTVPNAGFVNTNGFTRQLLGGWTFGGVLRYSSGLPIRVPGANNNLGSLLFQGTFANRVPGEPLFTKDLNCGCIDPNKEFVLNPKAWADPAQGEWGTAAAYYGDYRFQRRPDEQLSVGKTFRIRESMSLQFRAEFFNVFNRTVLPNPDFGNAQATQRTNAQGVPIAGFGRINAAAVNNQSPRAGQLVARFQF
jgi:hypothetical protein